MRKWERRDFLCKNSQFWGFGGFYWDIGYANCGKIPNFRGNVLRTRRSKAGSKDCTKMLKKKLI